MLLRNVTETNGLLHTCHLSSGGRHGRQAHADTRLREPGHRGAHTEPAKAPRTEVLMQAHTYRPMRTYGSQDSLTHTFTHTRRHTYTGPVSMCTHCPPQHTHLQSCHFLSPEL